MDFSADEVRSAISTASPEEAYRLLQRRMQEAEAPVIHLRSLLEQQMQATEAVVVRLKSIWNEQARICKLPAEVIAMILCFVVDAIGESSRASCWDRSEVPKIWKQLVQLTSVCKYWRIIALDYPRFWASVPFPSGKHRMDMLLRSKDAPRVLEICAKDFQSPAGSAEALAAVKWQMDGSRLLELILEFGRAKGRSLQVALDSTPRTEAPLLRRISIQSEIHRPVIPFHMLTRPMPVLRHLELQGCNIPWPDLQSKNAFPRNLNSLTLGGLMSPCPQALMYTILESSPGLQELVLRGEVLDPKTKPRMDAPVPLLSLCRCKIWAGTSFIYFYASVAWPEKLVVQASLDLNSETSLEAFLHGCNVTGLDRSIRGLGLFGDEGGTIEAPGLTCHLDWRGHTTRSSAVDLLRFSSLTKLTIEDVEYGGAQNNRDASVQGWSRFFRWHNMIQTLNIRGIRSPENIFAALGYQPSIGAEGVGGNISVDSEQSVVLPSLTRLSWCDFEPRKHPSPEALASPVYDNPFDAGCKRAGYATYAPFLDMLIHRANCELPWLRLDIDYVYGFEEVVKLVEEIVGEDCISVRYDSFL